MFGRVVAGWTCVAACIGQSGDQLLQLELASAKGHHACQGAPGGAVSESPPCSESPSSRYETWNVRDPTTLEIMQIKEIVKPNDLAKQ